MQNRKLNQSCLLIWRAQKNQSRSILWASKTRNITQRAIEDTDCKGTEGKKKRITTLIGNL